MLDVRQVMWSVACLWTKTCPLIAVGSCSTRLTSFSGGHCSQFFTQYWPIVVQASSTEVLATAASFLNDTGQ